MHSTPDDALPATSELALRHNEVSRRIIGAAIDVHRTLGPGLLESAYKVCLRYELQSRGLSVQCELDLPVRYKAVSLNAGYRLDFLVDNLVVVELKSVEKLLPVHEAQLITYLKLGGWKLGLLMNFNVPRMIDGIKRLIVGGVPD